MKRRLKVLAIILSVTMLLSTVGCASAKGNGAEPKATSSASIDYAQYGTTKEEVEMQHAKYGKGKTGIEDEIELGVVMVKVYPFALNYAYTTEDFSEIGCTEVKVVGTYPNSEMPTKILLLTISDKTLQGVSNAMEILNQRDDVYCAMPSEIMHVYPSN